MQTSRRFYNGRFADFKVKEEWDKRTQQRASYIVRFQLNSVNPQTSNEEK